MNVLLDEREIIGEKTIFTRITETENILTAVIDIALLDTQRLLLFWAVQR